MIRPVFLCVSFPLIACSAVLAQDETSLNRGAYGSVMTPEQVMRELGPGTGLLPGDQAYEGRPVKSVSVRYRSTGKTVSEDRLKNLLATQPGTSYSPEVVNKDLERLLESGLVGGNTTEERELEDVAKKYEIIGKKKEELAPVLKSLKAAGGTAYTDMIAVLDGAVAAVEKSGAFTEIGKSGGAGTTDGAAWLKAETQAAEIMKSKNVTKAQALDEVFQNDPELAAECEKEE